MTTRLDTPREEPWKPCDYFELPVDLTALPQPQAAAVRSWLDALGEAMSNWSYKFRFDDTGKLFVRPPDNHPYDAEFPVSDRTIYNTLRDFLLRIDPVADLPNYRPYPLAEEMNRWKHLKRQQTETRERFAGLRRLLGLGEGVSVSRGEPPTHPLAAKQADFRHQLALLQAWFEQQWSSGHALHAVVNWNHTGGAATR